MSSTFVRIGIIGARFGAAVHLPAFQGVEGCAVTGIVSRDPQHAAEVARCHGIRSFETWQEMVASPDIDAVAVATPPFAHQQIVSAAIDAGKAVFCEKPFCLTVAEAASLVDAAERARSVHMIDFEFREIPALRQLKQRLEAREVGRLRHVAIRWVVPTWSDPRRPWSWKCDRSQGGGVLSAYGVHLLDAIEWLFDPIASIQAVLGIAIPTRPDERGAPHTVTAPDHCQAILELTGGAAVTCEISTVANAETGAWIEVHGEHRSLLMGGPFAHKYVSGFRLCESVSGTNAWRECDVESTSLQDQDAADERIPLVRKLGERFIAAVSGRGGAVEPSFAAGLRTQVLMESLHAAAEGRCSVDVSPPQRA